MFSCSWFCKNSVVNESSIEAQIISPKKTSKKKGYHKNYKNSDIDISPDNQSKSDSQSFSFATSIGGNRTSPRKSRDSGMLNIQMMKKNVSSKFHISGGENDFIIEDKDLNECDSNSQNSVESPLNDGNNHNKNETIINLKEVDKGISSNPLDFTFQANCNINLTNKIKSISKDYEVPTANDVLYNSRSCDDLLKIHDEKYSYTFNNGNSGSNDKGQDGKNGFEFTFEEKANENNKISKKSMIMKSYRDKKQALLDGDQPGQESPSLKGYKSPLMIIHQSKRFQLNTISKSTQCIKSNLSLQQKFKSTGNNLKNKKKSTMQFSENYKNTLNMVSSTLCLPDNNIKSCITEIRKELLSNTSSKYSKNT